MTQYTVSEVVDKLPEKPVIVLPPAEKGKRFVIGCVRKGNDRGRARTTTLAEARTATDEVVYRQQGRVNGIDSYEVMTKRGKQQTNVTNGTSPTVSGKDAPLLTRLKYAGKEVFDFIRSLPGGVDFDAVIEHLATEAAQTNQAEVDVEAAEVSTTTAKNVKKATKKATKSTEVDKTGSGEKTPGKPTVTTEVDDETTAVPTPSKKSLSESANMAKEAAPNVATRSISKSFLDAARNAKEATPNVSAAAGKASTTSGAAGRTKEANLASPSKSVSNVAAGEKTKTAGKGSTTANAAETGDATAPATPKSKKARGPMARPPAQPKQKERRKRERKKERREEELSARDRDVLIVQHWKQVGWG